MLEYRGGSLAGVSTVDDRPPTDDPQHPMEVWISRVLRTGVLVAAGIILIGLALFLVRGPQAGEPATLQALIGDGGRTVPVSPAGLARDIGAGQPIAVIQAGLLVLILTPVVRVAMTLLLFLAARDRAFVAITGGVLAVLLLGLLGFGG
jgi:uncharacterized membrane protein